MIYEPLFDMKILVEASLLDSITAIMPLMIGLGLIMTVITLWGFYRLVLR